MPSEGATNVVRHLRRAALLSAGPEITDGQLLEDFLTRKDEAAFGMLVRRHGPLVLGVCQRVIGHRQEAEDAFQATFLVLARKAASVVPREAVGNWLYGVAYRTARRARAVAARRWTREKQVKMMPQTIVRPAGAMQDWEPILDEELSKLADKYRLPLVLCDLEGRSRKQVAQQLALPLGTLFSRLSRARQMLAQRLRRRGLTLSGAALATTLGGNAVLADVPLPLASMTIKAVTTVAAGGAATAAVSAKVAVLAQGVLKNMLLAKLKTFSTLLVLVLCLGGSAGALVCFAVVASPDAPQGTHGNKEAGKPRQTPGKDPPPQPRLVKTEGAVGALAWGAGGKILATLIQKCEQRDGRPEPVRWAVQLRDPRTGKIFKTLFESESKPVHSVAMTTDGKIVAAAVLEHPDWVTKLWDADTGKEKTVLKGGGGFIQSLTCSPDGKLLASAGWRPTGEVSVWEIDSGRLLWQQAQGREVLGLAFSPDSKLLAGGGRSRDKTDSNTLTLWDARKGTCKLALEGHGAGIDNASWRGVHSVAFSPDGKHLASGGLDGSVRLWDPATGKLEQTLMDAYMKGYTVHVAFAPDGKVLASSGNTAWKTDKYFPTNGDVKLWDLQTGKLKRTAMEHIIGICPLAFSPDGRTIAVGPGPDEKLVLLPVAR